jgi:dTDP-4-dehydrorhamnose reductase
MRVLLLGGAGMLGRAVLRRLAQDTVLTVSFRGAAPVGLPAGVAAAEHVDLRKTGALEKLLERAEPEAVVNAAGLIKQRAEAADPVAAIEMNALLPHRLRALCRMRGARLIHISTDCVFSGDRGDVRGPQGYREMDPAGPTDLYGRSKLLGEVTGPDAVTLRMSLVGPEDGTRNGLLAWFLAQRDEVQGYANALFTGLATPVAASLIAHILQEQPELEGIWHASAQPVSKLELLRLIRDTARLSTRIMPVEEPFSDRRLDGSALSARIGWQAPDWQNMVTTMLAPDETWGSGGDL